jgi:hypothetical protein
MTFVIEVFVKCFELYITHSMSINFYARCASRITHKPKRKQEKKTAKKKKKESHYFKGARIAMQGFWKKILPLLSFKNPTIEKKSVEILLQNTF